MRIDLNKGLHKGLSWSLLLALRAGIFGADASVDQQARIQWILANQEMCKHAKK